MERERESSSLIKYHKAQALAQAQGRNVNPVSTIKAAETLLALEEAASARKSMATKEGTQHGDSQRAARSSPARALFVVSDSIPQCFSWVLLSL